MNAPPRATPRATPRGAPSGGQADVGPRRAALAAAAAVRARVTGRPVLTSHTERLEGPAIDALGALVRAAAELAGADRMYWTRPIDGFELTGIGAARVIEPGPGVDRFAAVAEAWQALLADAEIDDPSNGAVGVGPLLMGGFAFDPDGPRTPRWRDFPRARFVLPRLLLTTVDGGRWLTTNVFVDADGRPDIPPATMDRLRGLLLEPETATAATTPPRLPARAAALRLAESRPGAEWRAAVADAAAAVRAGEMEKVVLAREVRASAECDLDVVTAVRRLRAAYRACYVFGVWTGRSAFVGASPERLVRLDGRAVRASSLAGSIRRGTTPDEDRWLAGRLLDSAKDGIEHAVVRDALGVALADLCDDVRVDAEPTVMTLPQIHHLHTDVRATLRPDRTLLDLARRLHPTPAVGGQPREAALRFIRQHEAMDRGWYAGPIGWVGRAAGELAVALRSALVTGAEATLYAGCGVVADSNADREYAESALKLRPMELALGAPGEPRDYAVREGSA